MGSLCGGAGAVEAGVWRFGGISTSEILDQRPPGGSIGDIGRKWALEWDQAKPAGPVGICAIGVQGSAYK